MRRKFRLFSTLTAMALVLVVLCVGIWAATSAKITSSGGSLTVNVSDQLLATVEFNFGTDGIVDEREPKFEYTAESGLESETVTLPNYTFTADDKDVSFEVKVTNDYLDGSTLTGEITSNVGEGAPFEVSITSEESLSNNSFTVPAYTESNKGSITFTVTVKYTGKFAEAVNETLNFTLTLSKATE